MSPVTKAREAFDGYAALDAPHLPLLDGEVNLSALQVQLYRWQVRNFGVPSELAILAGATEELGELAHALLKHHQGIRGMANREAMREAAGDAIADVVVYLIQLCTALRLDFGTLLEGTAIEVMERNWVTNPEDGGA